MENTTEIIPRDLSFRNDAKLKKPNAEMEFTPEQIQELIKCHENVYYFAENYFEIIVLDADKKGNRRKIIKCRGYQKRIIDSVVDHRFSIVLSPRQIGKTTLLRLLTLWYACFESDFEIVIASNKQATSTKTLRKIKESYKALPMWIKPGIIKWDETCVIFDNGSAIYASATSEDGCRGDSVNLLILDEFAHIRNRMADEFYTSVYPTISEGSTTRIVMISTPNGMSGPYYETWVKAKRKINRFNAVEVNWDEPPGRNEKWKAMIIADIGDRRCRQEYMNKFIGSSDTLIDAEYLESMLFSDDYIETPDHRVKKFHEPIEGHIYVAGGDVGEGIGKDGSVINIFDITDMNNIVQAAIYWSNTTITQVYQENLVEWAEYYNNAWIMLEANAIGDGVANHAWYDCEYENMVHHGHTRLGIKSNRKTKVEASLHMKYLLESNKVTVYDKTCISELSTFVDYGNNIYKAEEDTHDDCVLSMVWALYITHKVIAEQVDLDSIDNKTKKDPNDPDESDESDEPLGIFNSGEISNLEEELENISLTSFESIFGK